MCHFCSVVELVPDLILGIWQTLGVGREYESIDDKLRTFILAQPVFFVATAPTSGDGHVNCSPKGLRGTFAVTGPTQFAYLDLTGSGAETIAHLRENGRITVMFCAFEGPPRIVRLQGKGRVIVAEERSFARWRSLFGPRDGVRAVIVADLYRIADSCGYGVPRMELIEDRDHLDRWTARKGVDRLAEYRAKNNAISIDGLPALEPTVQDVVSGLVQDQ